MTRNALICCSIFALVSACSPTSDEAVVEPAGEPAPDVAQPANSNSGAGPVQAALETPDGGSAGQVILRQGPGGLLLEIDGENWPEGWHGVHLHAVGDCSAADFTSAAGHLNHPDDARPHGLLNFDGGPDFGDLQNVYAHADGAARAEVYAGHSGLTPGPGNLDDEDGLALVVHANRDDHITQPIGGAGDRIACAVLFEPGGR